MEEKWDVGKMNELFCVLNEYHDVLEIIIQAIAVIVAIVAACTYWFQKNNERKTAALLVINQIDDAEKIIDLLRKPENGENGALYKSPDIISENYWEKYKTVLMRYLKNSDIEILDRYYSNIALIQKGKNCIAIAMEDNWKCHSFEHIAILKEIACIKAKIQMKDSSDAKDQKELEEKERSLNILYNEDMIFRAGVGVNMLNEGFSVFESIKGTSAYKILERKSYRKN